MKVQDVMQPNVLCVVESMSVRDLYAELQANEIAGAPVLDANDYLVGVVSLTDIARCVAGGANEENPYYYGGMDVSVPRFQSNDIDKQKKVRDIMNQQVHKVNGHAEVEEALEIMVQEDIHRVIVTHRSHVVGIITAGDMMRLFLEMLGDNNEDEDDDEDL
jgi:CBS domain-containing protein